jgi:hypothetical protein
LSISFRVTKNQKQLINSVLDKVQEETGKNKSDSFVYLINEYVSLSSGGDIKGDMPISIQNVLSEIKKHCAYLFHRDNGFICLENVDKKKSEQVLGIVPDEVLDMCRMCLRRKAEKKQDELNKQRQKASIKKLLDFAKQFRTVIGKGVLKDLYFCFHDVYSDDSQIIFSTNGKTMKCPLEKYDIVIISEHCEKLVNPDNDKPPCKYLVPIEYLTSITDEDLKKHDLIFPQIEEQQEDIEDIETRINVEVDYEVKEDKNE